jgi:hypothetical protein
VLPCGHYTTGETPYKYLDGWYLGSFVYQAFKRLREEEAALRKKRLLEFLRDPEPAWKEEDHPELANGTYAWVRSLRQESEVRLRKIEERDKQISRSSAANNDAL